ncbi:LysR family transcriptional regulator [Paraburkholderia sp. 1N]|uniref:LysR family transcriptional regulator n=1 Tax=Paraburkholderia solitsugae TaxID=2675748 RepID=A0ABX2BQA4_9BURK|nr:LysR substrate-binding domain-containing protein [Paraburkholderia solitsugae]NPT43074.1 LysR family transcriptional regulator [Paraburkholderia solitsugae]
MLDLNDFYYFVSVVDRGGMTAASRSLSVPKSTISYRIQQLEASLGARLINRTTRQFSVTDAGLEFYKHAALMLEKAQAAEAIVKGRLVEPGGIVRVTTAVAIAEFATAKVLPEFLGRYPKINVIQHVTDASVDIVAENFDLAIRAHSNSLPDSNLIKRTLGFAPWRLFAGQRYVKEFGMPNSPEQLAHHNGLFMMRTGVQPTWLLRRSDGIEHRVPLRPRVMTNDMVGLKAAAQMGLGIVALPAYICREDVISGRLQPVLPEWSAGESTLTALLPFRHGVLPSVRAYLDFLISEIPKALVF